MFNPQQLIIEHFVDDLLKSYHQTYNTDHPEFGNIIAWTGRLALENIANSDTLYHNVEHTLFVTLVGQLILQGKHLCEGGVTPHDWLHFMIALLCHDIGYVRGICRADHDDVVATGIEDATVTLPTTGTNAVLQPYHVDRSKLFVIERFGEQTLNKFIDPDLIAEYIEMTRFPIPNDEFHQRTSGYHGLIRAADLIGQMGDPGYFRKIPGLFYEFEEIGSNELTGYTCPEDMRSGYAEFYWGVVYRYIQEAQRYLQVTQEGRLWLANLHAHIFDSEHPPVTRPIIVEPLELRM